MACCHEVLKRAADDKHSGTFAGFSHTVLSKIYPNAVLVIVQFSDDTLYSCSIISKLDEPDKHGFEYEISQMFSTDLRGNLCDMTP
jgi:hypothetical protein